jgi:hypothetical protein
MKKIFCLTLTALMLLAPALAYCDSITIGELVDQYKHATDVQRQDLEKHFLGKKMTAGGMIENVGEYNFFDVNTDTGENYYKVMTRQQETAGKTPYQALFLYKDKEKIKDMNKGDRIEKEGTIINIVDERLQISVWLYEDDLTSKDKQLFNLQ